ncbi:unnamed protein product [Gordionus sp. m RMFG-2023]
MFPTLKLNVKGLDSESKYYCMMDIISLDDFRYKYQSYEWTVSGKAELHYPSSRIYIHPESPALGKDWMKQPITYHKIKLTNNNLDQNGHIILNSMHKYIPRIHIIKSVDLVNIDWKDMITFVFDECAFVAVTAYQNEHITQLKIDNNPFAKGFRENGLSKRDRSYLKRHHEILGTDKNDDHEYKDEFEQNLDSKYSNFKDNPTKADVKRVKKLRKCKSKQINIRKDEILFKPYMDVCIEKTPVNIEQKLKTQENQLPKKTEEQIFELKQYKNENNNWDKDVIPKKCDHKKREIEEFNYCSNTKMPMDYRTSYAYYFDVIKRLQKHFHKGKPPYKHKGTIDLPNKRSGLRKIFKNNAGSLLNEVAYSYKNAGYNTINRLNKTSKLCFMNKPKYVKTSLNINNVNNKDCGTKFCKSSLKSFKKFYNNPLSPINEHISSKSTPITNQFKRRDCKLGICDRRVGWKDVYPYHPFLLYPLFSYPPHYINSQLASQNNWAGNSNEHSLYNSHLMTTASCHINNEDPFLQKSNEHFINNCNYHSVRPYPDLDYFYNNKFNDEFCKYVPSNPYLFTESNPNDVSHYATNNCAVSITPKINSDLEKRDINNAPPNKGCIMSSKYENESEDRSKTIRNSYSITASSDIFPNIDYNRHQMPSLGPFYIGNNFLHPSPALLAATNSLTYTTIIPNGPLTNEFTNLIGSIPNNQTVSNEKTSMTRIDEILCNIKQLYPFNNYHHHYLHNMKDKA